MWANEPGRTWIQIKVQAWMPHFSLNCTMGSSAIQRCQWCSSPTQRWSSWSQRCSSLKSALNEHECKWPSKKTQVDAKPTANLCNQQYLSLPPTRQDLTQGQWPEAQTLLDYAGQQGPVLSKGVKNAAHSPKGGLAKTFWPQVCLCWTMLAGIKANSKLIQSAIFVSASHQTGLDTRSMT